MKRRLCIAVLLLFTVYGFAQDYSGNYQATGYLYNLSFPRELNFVKTISQVSPGRYQMSIANLGSTNFYFQFEIDATNHLVNWSAVGATPAAPASGFMTLDNPGNFSFPAAPTPPGTAPYISSTYNNTYDPVNKIFYLHYGYTSGSVSQFAYSRQIYEKLELLPVPKISSVTPMTGTSLTEVTIKGVNFSTMNPAIGYGVKFGDVDADSAVVLSDTVIKAWVGAGASGAVTTLLPYTGDTFPGFVYTPVPPVAASEWEYTGMPGFSANGAFNVNAAIGKGNNMYVGYIDSADRMARVMKFNNNNWEQVGTLASDGKCNKLQMQTDSSGLPVIMYSDSTNNGYKTVKRFDGNNWVNLHLADQYPFGSYYQISIAVDHDNNIFVAYPAVQNNQIVIRVLKYNGNAWDTIEAVPANPNSVALAVSPDNHLYLFYPESDSTSYGNQGSIKMYNGTSWQQVGTRGFTNNSYGNYWPGIQFDTSALPVVAFEEDNGFERLSVFRYNGVDSNYALGRFFSRGRARYISQAIGGDNSIHVAYVDYSYNNRGTVLTYNYNTQAWDTVGARGSLPFEALEINSLFKDSGNRMYVAFADVTQNGRVSVMVHTNSMGFIWTGNIDTHWENPGNWSGGAVPTATSDAIINGNGTVIINSHAEVHTIHINAGATITVTPGNSLTVIRN